MYLYKFMSVIIFFKIIFFLKNSENKENMKNNLEFFSKKREEHEKV